MMVHEVQGTTQMWVLFQAYDRSGISRVDAVCDRVGN